MHTNITVTKQEHITKETKTHKGTRQRKQVTRQEQNTKGTKMTGKANKNKILLQYNSQSVIHLNGYTIFHPQRSPLGMASM